MSHFISDAVFRLIMILMCGIAGYLGSVPVEGDRNLDRMLASIARRGPDSEGRSTWPGVWLGHRRLAILDLSPAGHQPMLSEDGQVGLVFNGCIYNFLDLRRDLEALGHRFHSQCDTEVLLRGYLQWGIHDLAPRLHGMFAFAIWDARCHKLFLARDRMGVKPLLFASRGKEFAFGSTTGALAAAGFAGNLNPTAILEFLDYGYISDKRSIYSGIDKLLPGHLLEWSDGQYSQHRYWSLPATGSNTKISFDEAVEESERLLVEAVRLRLQADVPIAALLSGGIDSALVCWAMKKLNANVTAFTIGSPDQSDDESSAAAFTARTLDIPHRVVSLLDSQALEIDTLLDAFSEPFAAQSTFGILSLSRTIKPYGTVLLTGDGADDVYLGYPHFLNAWRAQNLARELPPFAANLWRGIRTAVPGVGPLQRMTSFLDYATGGLGSYIERRNGLGFLYSNSILGPSLASTPTPWRQIPPSLTAARNLFEDAFQYHWDTHFTGEFMPKVDGGTMHYALEARAPFLDQKIWEFAATLPVSLRFHNGVMKSIPREIVRRRIHPSIGTRPKQGFTVPVSRWLLGAQTALWDVLRSSSLLVSQGWIQARPLAEAVDRSIASGQLPPALWHLFVLEHWLRRYSKP